MLSRPESAQRSNVGQVTLAAVFLVFVAAANCGGSTATTDGEGSSGGATSLVATCQTLCDNVLSQCGVAATIYQACGLACDRLQTAETGCASDFTAYVACLAGATSVQCTGDGKYIVLSPPSCENQRLAYAACAANGSSSLTPCVAQPFQNAACPGATDDNPARFCAGQPLGCVAANSDGGAIGLYCCL